MLSLDGEPGFILHTRPYKEHSLLVELFTLNYGRLSAVARLSNKVASRSAGIYQPLIPLKMTLKQSRGSLWTLSDAFMQRGAYKIDVPTLFCAIYVNELIYNLVKTHESMPKLFAQYLRTLEDLEAGEDSSLTLRAFETALIENLGYGIDYSSSDQGDIQDDLCYHFDLNSGFLLSSAVEEYSYSGHDLINIRHNDMSSKRNRDVLKKINKCVIDSLLEGRKLKSRELYAQFLMVK